MGLINQGKIDTSYIYPNIFIISLLYFTLNYLQKKLPKYEALEFLMTFKTLHIVKMKEKRDLILYIFLLVLVYIFLKHFFFMLIKILAVANF